MPHGGHFPFAFTFQGGGPQLHNLSIVVDDKQIGWLSIPRFIEEVAKGVERWLAQYGESDRVLNNLEKFAHLRPEGLPPHFDGPVIA